MGGKLWDDLPELVQKNGNIESFKRHNKIYKLLISPLLIQQFCYCFATCQFLCV